MTRRPSPEAFRLSRMESVTLAISSCVAHTTNTDRGRSPFAVDARFHASATVEARSLLRVVIPWTSSSQRSRRFSSLSRIFSCSDESNGSESESF